MRDVLLALKTCQKVYHIKRVVFDDQDEKMPVTGRPNQQKFISAQFQRLDVSDQDPKESVSD